MRLVSIAHEPVNKMVFVTFAENLEPFLSLFKDTRYLIDNCLQQEGNMIHLSEEGFQTYIDSRRTIPMLVTMKIEENMERVEYALNYVLGELQKELGEECERIERHHPLLQDDAYKQLEKKTEALIQKAYRDELARKVFMDLREHQKEHSSGFYYDGDLDIGM